MDATTLDINSLPDELLENIFSHLPVEDLAFNVQHVCVRWSEVCSHDALWKDITYSTQMHMSDEHIISVLEKVPKLRQFLTLTDSSAIFNALSKYCKKLRKLEAPGIFHGGCKEALLNIFTECTKLEELVISDFVLQHDEVTQFLAQSKTLYSLSLVRLYRFDSPLKHFADGCLSLKHLDIQELYSYSDLEYFLEKKGNTLLSLGMEHVTEEGTCSLPLVALYGTSLRLLQLYGGNCNSCKIGNIRTLTNLKSLKIDVANYDMGNLFMGNTMSHILDITVGGIDVMNSALIDSICLKCPNLLKLRLEFSDLVPDHVLQFIYLCKKLEDLQIESLSSLTSINMYHIALCNNLKCLSIKHFPQIKGDFLHLMKLSKLRDLCIVNCGENELLLELLPLHLQNLRNLKLSKEWKWREKMAAVNALRVKMPHLRIGFL